MEDVKAESTGDIKAEFKSVSVVSNVSIAVDMRTNEVNVATSSDPWFALGIVIEGLAILMKVVEVNGWKNPKGITTRIQFFDYVVQCLDRALVARENQKVTKDDKDINDK